MLSLLAAAALAGAAAPQPALFEASHAIASGRLQQARTMIANAVAAGAAGATVDRLLADLSFAEHRDQEALIRYRALHEAQPGDTLVAERAAISALRLGDVDAAAAMAARATESPTASWRAWNALAVTADLKRDWSAADAAYARAIALAPDQAELNNNIGWSHMLRGNWEEAIGPLERAAALTPKSRRIADNLELARAATAEDLPRRQAGESDRHWAARLNDAGVVAKLLGDEARAVAAFARAIEARDVWYARAWNNLQSVQQAQ